MGVIFRLIVLNGLALLLDRLHRRPAWRVAGLAPLDPGSRPGLFARRLAALEA
nr:hypothetical protein [uncultured Lichenicoccus sp.]